MPSTWRKLENEKGFPYYVNEMNNVKQWDHPKFGDIKQRVDDCNYIKYAAYRVASKFRVLQHALYTEDISINIISGVFEKHRLGITEGSLCLDNYDVEAVLSDIYFAANKHNHTNIDIDYAAELLMNFLYNVFDKNRTGTIQVSSTKLVLAILSNSKLTEIYRFIFNMCADHNNCVTRLRLQTILSKISEITTFMHEDVSFGQHLVNHSVDECFSNSPGLVGVNENTFVNWLETSPLLISWLPALSRLRSSESTVYPSKCATCKTTPLIGLRYRCSKCSRYIQCQRCFLTGRISHSHKLNHSMREYCADVASKEHPLTLLKKLCRLIKCTNSLNETYCTYEPESKTLDFEKNLVITCSFKEEPNNTETLTTPLSKLQHIIKQLEQQNSELWHILTLGNKNDKEIKKYLEDHRLKIDAQIDKLKALKDSLQPTLMEAKIDNFPNNVESTPMVPSNRILRRSPELDLFSPICVEKRTNENLACVDLLQTADTVPDVSATYGLKDLSTWIGGHPQQNNVNYQFQSSETDGATKNIVQIEKYSPVREMHTDLDEALAKLQQILANNFTLDESLGNIDNGQLKNAVTEVEGMLTSLIDTVENSRASSTQPALLPMDHENHLLQKMSIPAHT